MTTEHEPRFRRPPGRPSHIDHIVAHIPILDPDGQPTGETRPVTAAERIVQHLRTGGYFEAACAAAGVSKHSGYLWLRKGANITHRLAAITDPEEHDRTWNELTPTEQAYAQFSDAVARAEAEALTEDVARLQQLARGGTIVETVTEKRDADGNLIESTVRREKLPPNPQVAEWRLERRHPELFGRQRVEVTGVDGGPVELSLAEKRERVAASLSKRAAQLASPPVGEGESDGEDDSEV